VRRAEAGDESISGNQIMPRLKDISAAAGVSARTVSRALKNEGRVSATVKAKVRRLAKQMGYRPDPLARALRTGKSTEILVLLFEIDELRMGRVAGLEAELTAAGYSTRIIHVEYDRTEISRTVRELAGERIAGLAVDGSFLRLMPADGIAPLQTLGVPVVVLSSFVRGIEGSYIDRVHGIVTGVTFLHERGHRAIAYLGLLHDPSRVDGYMQASRDLGLTPVFVPFEDGPDRFAAGRHAVDAFLEMSPRATAVQTHSDEIALGFMAGLRDRGRRVPDDVAVVGFDDRQAAAWSSPPLTTIAQPSRKVGVATAQVLLAKLNGDGPPSGGWCQVLRPELIVRETV